MSYCFKCGGSGKMTCTTCNGTGLFRPRFKTDFVDPTCYSCLGERTETCDECGGSGEVDD